MSMTYLLLPELLLFWVPQCSLRLLFFVEGDVNTTFVEKAMSTYSLILFPVLHVWGVPLR